MMKKFKFIFVIIALIFMIVLTGCQKNNDSKENLEQQDSDAKTVASVLANQFLKEIPNEKDIKKVIENLAKNDIIKINVNVEKVESGDYISGFQTKITGFNEACAIKPTIGTIPFIAYIFEVDNPSEFAETLNANYDLRWNICTEAEEQKTTIYENYVFFVMSLEDFDEE